MKKVLLFIAILFFFDRFGQAQSLTIEYNIGHGSYQMSDMKDILKNQMLPVTNVQVTDNFPGYVMPVSESNGGAIMWEFFLTI